MVVQLLTRNFEIDKKYEEAENHYKAVGEWLAGENSDLARYNPDIYAQGSFALGTAIKPIGREEYDVDAVCKLDLSLCNITQAELKHLVGNRLKAHDKYKGMLEEKRRCWALNYSVVNSILIYYQRYMIMKYILILIPIEIITRLKHFTLQIMKKKIIPKFLIIG